VYRRFTRIGGEKVPDEKTLGRVMRALGPEVVEGFAEGATFETHQRGDGYCLSESRLQDEKTALAEEKARTREQLDLHIAQVITQYGQSINRYLERIK
jgi:hypothetical protein